MRRGRRWVPPGAGDDAELDLGKPEAGALGGETEVRGQGELAAAAQRVAVDGGDRHLGKVGPSPEGGVQELPVLVDFGHAHRLELAHIGAGGKVPAVPGDHHRPDRPGASHLHRRGPQAR